MAKIEYPAAITSLHAALKKLPGIGPRSAERIAVWMIQSKKASPIELADALAQADSQVKLCSCCGFFEDEAGCKVCNASNRDKHVLCVVEQPTDVLALENSGVFNGYYHCLGGKLSPLENVTPDDLLLHQLEIRVKNEPGIEVILALTTDVEGEATSNYITDILSSEDCNITRMAQGLPAGGALESVDALTIIRALQGRR